MAKCELSGKASVSKNLVSHSNIKTKSRALPNIQSKKFFSYQLKNSFRFKVATSAVRDIDKVGGFDVFIIKQKDKCFISKSFTGENSKFYGKQKGKLKRVKNEIKN